MVKIGPPVKKILISLPSSMIRIRYSSLISLSEVCEVGRESNWNLEKKRKYTYDLY